MFRASFSLCSVVLLSVAFVARCQTPGSVAKAGVRTRVSIEGSHWRINGRPTYPGARASGLLMNVRMVNAVFEDRNRKDFDPEANSREFVARMPDYVANGIRAFTLSLQGGAPGYEGAINSAFNADGSLRQQYLDRVRRVIEACDQNGAVVILSCFYQRQDQVLRDESAVRAGVVNVARWLAALPYGNVVLEVTNEFGHNGFDARNPAECRRPGGVDSTGEGYSSQPAGLDQWNGRWNDLRSCGRCCGFPAHSFQQHTA